METEFSRNIHYAAKAADRYEGMVPLSERRGYKRMSLIMDLTAADGVNGNAPLDWDRLLAADDFNFLHDLSGISSHMDRLTGRIGGFFVPRFTKKEAVA